jgi:hypothetical protein
LAEHDDADIGMRLTQPIRRLDPLVGVARRHPDVRDDDLRPLCIYRCQQGVEVAAHGNDLDGGLGVEEPLDTLAHDQVIIREHDPDRHGGRIRRCPSR